MKPAIESISKETKRLLFIDANPLIALYENNKNSKKAKIGFRSIERVGFECIILWPIIFEVRKRLSERNVRDARDFADKFCPPARDAKVPFKLTIEMPDEDSIYCAQKVVNYLNKDKTKPIVSDEDALLAKYA
jgi:predicted nucleic acid-binding protein